MKKFSRFLTTIVVFMTVFAFSCMPAFAADSDYTSCSATHVYAGGDIAILQSFGDTDTTISSSGGGVINTHYDVASYESSHWCGAVISKSRGYLTGVLNLQFSVVPSFPSNPSGSETDIELANFDCKSPVSDGSLRITRFYLASGVCRVQLNFNDYYMDSNTVYFDTTFKYAVGNTAGTLPPYLSLVVTPTIVSQDLRYASTLTGPVPDNLQGFNNDNDSLSAFIESGSSSESSMTDTAKGNIDKFNYVDFSNGSMLSSLSFYSSCINLAYNSLDDNIKLVFSVGFGLFVLIAILRIRRDSS